MNDTKFESAEKLADWLENIYETTEDGAILANRKWEPAQIAASAIRAHLAGGWGIND